jgi:hypothetical protein
LCDTARSGVVVTTADKGGSVVVWCRDAYVRCGLDFLLGDPSTSDPYYGLTVFETDDGSNNNLFDSSSPENHPDYRLLSGGAVECAVLHSDALAERARLTSLLVAGKCLREGGGAWMDSQASVAACPIRFHPKTHKDVCAATGTFQGRPIVNTVRSVTRPIDKYLSIICRPLLSKIPFTSTGTRDLLWRLRSLNQNCLDSGVVISGLHSADVVSMYPSVRLEEAVAFCVRFYASYHPLLVRAFAASPRAAERSLLPPSVQLFESLLRFVLTRNYVVFPPPACESSERETGVHAADTTGSMYFVQCRGVAMGSCISTFVAGCYVWESMRPVCTDIGLLWTGYRQQDPQQQSSCAPFSFTPDSLKSSTSNSSGGGARSTPTRILFVTRFVDDLFAVTGYLKQEQEQERRQRRQHEGDAAWESFCAGVSFNSPGLSLVLTTKHGSPNLRYLDLDLTIVHHPATKRAIVSTQKNSTSGPPCKKSRTEKKEEENPAVSTVIKGPPDDFVLWKASTTASSTTTTTTTTTSKVKFTVTKTYSHNGCHYN